MTLELQYLVPGLFVVLGGFFALGWLVSVRAGKNKIESAQERATKIISEAEKDAGNLKKEKLLEVKDEWYKKKQQFDQEANAKRGKIQAFEKQLADREENLERKVELFNKKDRDLTSLKGTLEERLRVADEKNGTLERIIAEENQRLERASGLSREEAKKILLENLVNETKTEAAQMLKDIRDTARGEAKKEAQKIVIQAIQRTAADHCVETTVSVLHIQSDEMKGRII